VHARVVAFRRIRPRAGKAEATLLTSGDCQVGDASPEIASVKSGRVVFGADPGHPRVRADERRIALVRRIGPVAGHTESARLASGHLGVLDAAAVRGNQPGCEATEDVLIWVVRLLGHGAELVVDVGAALVDYLQKGRPKSSSERIFLRGTAPYGELAHHASVYRIVQSALKRSGLRPPHGGAHLLRHSLATCMLRQGASLAQIGQVLRHQLPQTTEIYAKVDLNALCALALPWPGGVL